MTKNLKLLIIEDDPHQIEMYQDNIDVYNYSNKVNIEPICINNLEDGLQALQNPDYDAAIIDLRLSPGDQNGEGNKIITKIRSSLRIPIIIVSGYPQDLDAQYKTADNPFIKVHKKDDELNVILDEIVAIYKTGITNILGKKGHIEDYLNNIFWNHLSSTVDYWKSQVDNESDTEKILLRYTLSHLQEHLELSDTQEDFEEYLPIEMYVSPPIKKNPFTGDIIRCIEDGSYWIILNPSCDMAQSKAKSVTVAEIEKIENDYTLNLKKAIKKATGEEALGKQMELQKLLRNSGSLKYHFLPGSSCFEGGFINFQKIKSIRYKSLDKEFSRVASVTDRFAKDIIARFSHYYSRQGQPDFNTSKILEELLKENKQEEKV
ncbi:response regulator [Bacillus mycoides]|uniref:response regulator n=1 Tax=Bacillus mycoides TaxID=1405 RepID=UPI001C5F1C6C|nr:response regulator [Bacillus mycoides]